MAKKPGPMSVAVYQLQKKFGWRKAMWLLDFMAAWAVAVRANEWQPIDAEQYAEYWRMSRAKGYRDQQIWRDLFPDEPTPNERVIAARKQYEQFTAELGKEPSKGDFAAVLCTMPAA
jgi:hypothetical protein